MGANKEVEYEKIDIAREYLDLAMREYIDQHNFFCVIHLAAAAEELFGMHLPEAEERNYEKLMRAQQCLDAIEEVNRSSRDTKKIVLYPKNDIKHMDDENEKTLSMDAKFHAREYIESALKNAGKYGIPKSITQKRYEQFAADEHRQEFN